MIAPLEGLRTGYDVSGPECAATIVFVHGLAASRDAWDDACRRLESRFRTLRYDLRGHGQSAALPTICSRSDLARDLVGLLDVLGVERAVVVGHSAGGVIAMQAAIDFPARVAGLVLVATASECNARTAKWYADAAEQARIHGGETAMRAMGIRKADAPIPDGATFANLALAMRSLHDDPLTPLLREVSTPALVIVGEKDFLGVGGSVILSRTIEGAELEIRSGVGHGVHIEEPEWFTSRIERFVTDRVLRRRAGPRL